MEEHRHRDVVVIGAGVSGIYQIKRLIDAGFDAIVLEADDDLGGTWYRNRYPGCRFDSESYTYGYSFSRELMDEWHWKERFSSQPENLRYLNHVAEKFDLRAHMRFGLRVERMDWQEDNVRWQLQLSDGSRITAQYVIASLGPLSMPVTPDYPGLAEFKGRAFHTYHWPKEPLELAGMRVGVVGTGATGIQVISAIAEEVEHLTVFQRRPNWSTPLNNSPISEAEMADIRSRFDSILAACAESPGGFEHSPRRGFWDADPATRRALWDELYDTPGFALVFGNYAEVFMHEDANREMSDYVADRIRQRVDDPAIAEKLIPKDHGFATQRLPLETDYFEVYNRANVELVDILEDPIERITPAGIRTGQREHELDLIVWATGFDAITGAYDRIDIRGVDGRELRHKWRDGPSTLVGVLTHGFPNLLMVAGPQGVSGSTNFPRAIEGGVDWIMGLLEHGRATGAGRIEADAEAEAAWVREVQRVQDRMLLRNSRGWFTGYNANVPGRSDGPPRYLAYFGGAPRYATHVAQLAADGYPGVTVR